ncbi:MAG: NAD(P)/FAD-dependent oxidoreductase [bacterium]|nr:NAD(P)/FAD-dependent oxidoreductase [bacterium]
MDRDVVVIGAGPAGLTAAYLLAKASRRVTVLEADPVHVGGIARTVEHQGFRFDVGPHRFFSKAAEVEALWDELLPGEMLSIDRRTRIHYRGRYFSYPLDATEALRRMGVRESALAGLSFLRAQAFPVRDPRSFEDWVSNAFGRRLFETFFRTYTEKVWGMRCTEISADWAAQRIKGLSLGTAIRNAVVPKRGPQAVKSLIETFRYPRRGTGTMWEAAAERTRRLGGEVRLGCRVTELTRLADGWRVGWTGPDGARAALTAPDVISSAAMRDLAPMLESQLHGRHHAEALRYRDFCTVILFVRDRGLFDDHWLYIHDPEVHAARIQNFRSWSEALIPLPGHTALGIEYFCFEHDDLWARSDAQLVALATSEVETLKLVAPGDVVGGCVERQPRAYPVYDADYATHVAALRDELAARLPGLHLVGRNGMHRYNNQDHAMMTAMLTVENVLTGEPRWDPWRVNQDAEYIEEDAGCGASGLRQVPQRLRA